MKNITSHTLLIASAGVVVLAFIYSLLWVGLGYGSTNITLIFIAVVVSLVLSVSGLIKGLVELKKEKFTSIWLGIIGNLLILLFLGSVFLYGLEQLL